MHVLTGQALKVAKQDYTKKGREVEIILKARNNPRNHFSKNNNFVSEDFCQYSN